MALMGPLDEGWPEHSGGRPSGHGGWTMLHALARQLADEYSVAVTGAGSGVALRTLLPNVEHYRYVPVLRRLEEIVSKLPQFFEYIS